MLLGLGKTLTFGQKKIYPYATGGDYVYLYEEGNKTYRVHEFHTTGTSTLNVEVGGQVECLIVGGGGGGGRRDSGGGGGGAGGVLLLDGGNSLTIESGTYTVTVGTGGAGSSVHSDGGSGGNSSLVGGSISKTAIGGGGGGGALFASNGLSGGSGGGGSGGFSSAGSGGSGTSGQGYEGGDGSFDSSAVNNRNGGGGGGASEAGSSAEAVYGDGGDGGDGVTVWGTDYGGGGGGASRAPVSVGGIGGLGGGGNGGGYGTKGGDGLANTGGGGGGNGGGNTSGTGGSGIVIVRYVIAEKTLWTPSELTSLKAWYKADSLSLSDGDPVSTWNDDSGNGYNLTGTGTGRPLFQTNTINGLPVIEFDGTDDFLQASTASDWSFMHSGAAGNSFFAVALSNYTTTTARGSLAWTSPFSSVKRGWTWAHEGGGGSGQRNYILVFTGTASTYVARNKAGFGSLPPSVPIISSQIGDPTNATASERSSIRIDGGTAVEANTDTATPSSLDPDSPLTLGKSGDSGMAWLDGWFGELIFYDTKLNDTDRQKIEGYLAHKWGLTDNLPSGHPYKYEPPYKEEPEEIVTDGLVLNLDAGDYASYPRSGTTWYDISGNGLNGTLTNGPTYDSANKGSIVFDGSDDYVDVSSTTPTSLQGNPSFTVEGWFKKSGSWSGGSSWGLGGGTNLQGINSFNSSGTDEITIDLWGTSTYTTNIQYSSTEWKHIAWTYNGQGFTTSNIIIYINGVAYTGNDLEVLRGGSGTPNINNNGIILGRAGRTVNDYYGKPIIGNFRIYSKVLSSTEIQQNYDALKGRYGL